MGLWDSIIGGGVGKLVKDVVGTFHLSPEAKLEFEREIAAKEHDLARKDKELEGRVMDLQSTEIEAARDVVKAELATGDKYTSRARPTFVYVVLGVIVHNYVIVSYIGSPPIDFPDQLFDVMTMVLLGIVGGRSLEKVMKWRSETKK